MSDKQDNRQTDPDEIDLGQLFGLFRKAFLYIFKGFLRVYLYLKNNSLWIAGLIILGGLTGFLVNQLVEDKQKLEVIVTPNVDTKNYLYDVISEIQADIKAKDTAFFNSLGMNLENMKGFEIAVTPFRDEGKENDENSEMLEFFKDFNDTDAVADILRQELLDKTTRDQRIAFYFKDPQIGKSYVKLILEYINSNDYYAQLLITQRSNSEDRIRRNDSLVRQIDELINTYTNQIGKDKQVSEGRLLLENQESLDVPSLFELKNRLIRDTEKKRLELVKEKEAITIVNFGNPHKVIKPLFQKNVVFFPLLFVGIFMLVTLIKYLNRKASELL